MASLFSILREKGQFIPGGFRDEDGEWHDGPHSAEFAKALSQLEHAVREAYHRRVPETDRWFCQVCRKIGGHVPACPGALYSLAVDE
jgi:hypothetical protein